MELGPVTLRGRRVTLEPLDERHAAGLFDAMRDEEVCRYLAWPPPTALDDTRVLIRDAQELMARGQCIAFAQVWHRSGTTIGSTRFLDIRPKDRQVDTEWPAVKARLEARLGALTRP